MAADIPVGRDPLLGDPALAEALGHADRRGRLSDGQIRAMRTARRRAIGAGGAGLVALTLVVGVAQWQGAPPATSPPPPLRFATVRGQHADVQLADGSRIVLNGATSIDVVLSASDRRVVLRAGEAYFDVAHDPARPFVVAAGGSSARVLGTAFDLDRTASGVDLAVYRGAVRYGAAAETGYVVKAGWRSRFRDGHAAAPSRFDPSRQDWREGWLDTDGLRLADLVEMLNRQQGPAVAVSSTPGLADLRVSGRFRIDDPARLLDAMGIAYGFHVVPTGTELRIDPGATAAR